MIYLYLSSTFSFPPHGHACFLEGLYHQLKSIVYYQIAIVELLFLSQGNLIRLNGYKTTCCACPVCFECTSSLLVKLKGKGWDHVCVARLRMKFHSAAWVRGFVPRVLVLGTGGYPTAVQLFHHTMAWAISAFWSGFQQFSKIVLGWQLETKQLCPGGSRGYCSLRQAAWHERPVVDMDSLCFLRRSLEM